VCLKILHTIHTRCPNDSWNRQYLKMFQCSKPDNFATIHFLCNIGILSFHDKTLIVSFFTLNYIILKPPHQFTLSIVQYFDHFFIDVLSTLALIKRAKFLICGSSGKFQNDLDDQDLMLATVGGKFYCQQNVRNIIFENKENYYTKFSFFILRTYQQIYLESNRN
jgi:hypothetical protein